MNTILLNDKFAKMGARLMNRVPVFRGRDASMSFSLDVRQDRKGEYFEVLEWPGADLEWSVLDLRPTDRHLLLLVREDGEKHKFLCGHDERHWFVAGIPESAPVGTVSQAKEALKPREVLRAQARKGLRGREASRRKNAAFVRQGEWFFIPAPSLAVEPKFVLRNEPLSRGVGSKPHWVEFCYRTGGELVYVGSRFTAGVTESQYRELIAGDPSLKKTFWRTMRRNALVYVRGRISHADHKTITLGCWHRVAMNTEGESRARKNVVFLD